MMLRKTVIRLVVCALALGLGVTPAFAQASAPAPATQAPREGTPPATPQTPAPPTMELGLSGFYEFNGYTQNNFFLGKNATGGVSDGDDYMIQLFRIQPEISYGPNVKGVMRIDLAQKILGFDNEQRDNFRGGFSNLYNNKDTSFLVHLDLAYVELTVPVLAKTTFRVGRMKNVLGNMLVLDQDGDGVQVTRLLGRSKWRFTADWTKQSEGADSLSDDNFTATGGIDGRDADLFYLDLNGPVGAFTLNPYVMFYNDDNSNPYIPNLLQYNRPRFTPQLSQAVAFGTAFTGKVGKATLRGEADGLVGEDDIRNAHSGANQINDVNNGDLHGFTAYADVKAPIGKGTVGAMFGIGSGDDDPMSGHGNLVKIRTNGFFYATEVWEDSIMPDEEGITPQGLGSPGSRGYREFENTTMFQLNYAHPVRNARVFVSASVMRATEALHPWSDLNKSGFIDPGEFGTARSKDLGQEFDVLVDWTVMPNVIFTVRGGYMWAGDAAGYLINGTNAFNKNPWELRTTLRFNFAGLKLK